MEGDWNNVFLFSFCPHTISNRFTFSSSPFLFTFLSPRLEVASKALNLSIFSLETVCFFSLSSCPFFLFVTSFFVQQKEETAKVEDRVVVDQLVEEEEGPFLIVSSLMVMRFAFKRIYLFFFFFFFLSSPLLSGPLTPPFSLATNSKTTWTRGSSCPSPFF